MGRTLLFLGALLLISTLMYAEMVQRFSQ